MPAADPPACSGLIGGQETALDDAPGGVGIDIAVGMMPSVQRQPAGGPD
jgi:hypothetical protein